MPPDANPYVGPRPFESDDADFFFGRDREVSDLVALIVSNPVVIIEGEKIKQVGSELQFPQARE